MKTLVSLTSFTLAGALLAGCAGIDTLSSDVSSFGDWPADRKAGTYAFDRLPSQEAQAAQTERLETAARPALQKAGFTPAPAGSQPDVLVQVGARVERSDPMPWGDPLWWRGGFGHWRHGPWIGPSWALQSRYDNPRYDREVALLLRDRGTGRPLYEARASNEGWSAPSTGTLGAMFDAALMDFPRLGVNPRKVVVQLAAQQ